MSVVTRGRRWTALAVLIVAAPLGACAAGGEDAIAPTEVATATATPSPTPTESWVSGELRSGLAWSEEFDRPDDASIDETRWIPIEWAEGEVNNERQAYTARTENLVHDGEGALRIIAREEEYSVGDVVGDFTSGRIESRQSFRYGRIEARVKAPAGTGLWSAFWLLGNFEGGLQWPAVGEIDIFELVEDASELFSTVHGSDIDGNIWHRQNKLTAEESWANDWHVYAVDWSRESVAFSVDGDEYYRVNRDELKEWELWPFDRSSHIILNVAVGGSWPAPPNDSSVFPAEMLVDYVRVYDSEVYSEGDTSQSIFPDEQIIYPEHQRQIEEESGD